MKWIPLHTARITPYFVIFIFQVPTATTYSDTALNKCLWHSSGHHIAAGDDTGKIHVYDVNEVRAIKGYCTFNGVVTSMTEKGDTLPLVKLIIQRLTHSLDVL